MINKFCAGILKKRFFLKSQMLSGVFLILSYYFSMFLVILYAKLTLKHYVITKFVILKQDEKIYLKFIHTCTRKTKFFRRLKWKPLDKYIFILVSCSPQTSVKFQRSYLVLRSSPFVGWIFGAVSKRNGNTATLRQNHLLTRNEIVFTPRVRVT